MNGTCDASMNGTCYPACFRTLASTVALCLDEAQSFVSPLHDEAAQAGQHIYHITQIMSWWQLSTAGLALLYATYNFGGVVVYAWAAVLGMVFTALMLPYQIFMILLSAVMLSFFHNLARLYRWYRALTTWVLGRSRRKRLQLHRQMSRATSWDEWRTAAETLDGLNGKDAWKAAESGDTFNHEAIVATTAKLRDARMRGDARGLVDLLTPLIERNHFHVDATRLHVECLAGTKRSVSSYMDEVRASLRWVRDCSTDALPLGEKIEFFERSSLCLGHTALGLSGGGALCMYHLGVVKAMIEANCLPPIVSGASAGSFIAAIMAVYTDEELARWVIEDGCLEKHYPNIPFPPARVQLTSYVRDGCLVPHDSFSACVKSYFGDTTFMEAYEKTQRTVNINVSSSSGAGQRRGALLLNHLTTPHVLIRSAVHASCCLPTIMHPTELLKKEADGTITPFMRTSGDDGRKTEWMDGSFTADVPRKRMAELFHVTQIVVSQVNPHVVAMMNVHEGESYTLFRRLTSWLETDLFSRLQTLAALNLLPKLYGADIKAIALRQKFTGDLNILPRLKWPMCVPRMVQTPNRQQMGAYIHEGMQATFKKMAHLQHLMIIESELRDGLAEVYADPEARLAVSSGEADPTARPAPMSRAPSELHRKLAQSAVSPKAKRKQQSLAEALLRDGGGGGGERLPESQHGSSSSLSSSVVTVPGGLEMGAAPNAAAGGAGGGAGGEGFAGGSGGGGGSGSNGRAANGKEGEAAQSLRRISSLALAQVSAALSGRSRKDDTRSDDEPDGAMIADALSGFGGGGGEAASVGVALAARHQRPETPPLGGRELVAVAPGGGSGGGGGGGTLALPPGTLAKLVHEKQVLQERLSVAEAKNERLEATLHHMQEVIYHAVGGPTGLPMAMPRSSSRGRGLAGLG